MTFTDDEKNTREVPFAKLKSNLLGTQFTLYDNGMKPNGGSNTAAAVHDNDDDEVTGFGLRKEFVSVMYGLNVLGFKGPRQMKGKLSTSCMRSLSHNSFLFSARTWHG